MWERTRTLRLRVTALTAAWAFLCASLGVAPTSEWLARVGVSLSGERFPCEGGRCGCSSAQECWTTCLCQSLSEKIAWSERVGVEVPAYVDVDAARATSSSPAPACPLCELHTGAGSERAPARDRPGPDLTPIGCKGLNLLAASGVVLGVRDALASCVPALVGVERFWSPSSPTPTAAVIEVPSPPPRA